MVMPGAAAKSARRGMAVFVVMVIIVLLSALGVFAVRSTSLANKASGYQRQATQVHYITDYALATMASELGGPRRGDYATIMASGSQTDCLAQAALTNPTCAKVSYDDLQTQLQTYSSTNVLLLPAVPNASSAATPGSLGPAAVEGDMALELTDLSEASPPIPGMDLTSGPGQSLKHYTVTISAFGQVRPMPQVANQCDVVSASAAGIEASRAHMVIGPLPPP